VVGYVRATGAKLADEGIRVCALCPGFTDTPLIADHKAQFGELPSHTVRRSSRAISAR